MALTRMQGVPTVSPLSRAGPGECEIILKIVSASCSGETRYRLPPDERLAGPTEYMYHAVPPC